MNEDPRIMAMKYFIARGMSPYGAAGLVGNLYRESNLVPTVKNDSSGAYGIAQWLGSRKTLLFLKYGTNPSLELQLEFVWHELNDTHKRGLKMLNASDSAESAARNAMGYYEFMAGPEAAIREMRRWGLNGERSMSEGIKFANDVYDMYNKHSKSLLIPQETVILQPRFFDKTYSAKLPEVVITGRKPNLNLPNLNDLLRTGLDKLLLSSLGMGPEGFDYNKYAFLFTPPAFKDGKDPENMLDSLFNVYKDKAYALPRLSTYDIPYINEKGITLTNAGLATGARLSTNMLDTLATYAEKVGLPVKTALGLATKESTLGNPTDDTTIYRLLNDGDKALFQHANAMREELGESAQHINTGRKVSPSELLNYYAGAYNDPYNETLDYVFGTGTTSTEDKVLMLKNGMRYADKQAEKYLKNFPDGYKNYVEDALEFYKNFPDKWNPGLKNYKQLVDKRANEVWGSPEIQEWYKDYQNKKKIVKPVILRTAKLVSNLFKRR